MNMLALQDSRQWPRHNTDINAVLQTGQCTIIGKIHDLSGGGIFFEPEHGYVDGDFVDGKDCLFGFDTGDTINISMDNREKPSTIRWAGYHGRHGCGGFGLMFNKPLGLTKLER